MLIEAVNYIPETETELIKACTSKDKVIIIKDASNWKTISHGCIAFNIDDSGQYKDLPNFNLSTRGIDKIEKFGQVWKIYLLKEIGCNYPSHTKIREHKGGWTYIYSAACGSSVPNSWTKYQSLSTAETYFPMAFFPGTKYVRIFLMTNDSESSDVVLSLKNIKLVEY